MAGKYKGEEYVQNYESVPVQLFSTFTSIEFQHKLWQKITQTFEPQLTWITTDLTIELKWISIDLWKYCWIFFPFRAVGDSINSVHKMCTNTDYRNGELYSIHSKGSLPKHRKNCECCAGHSLIVNHYISISWFKFHTLSVIVNCVTK